MLTYHCIKLMVILIMSWKSCRVKMTGFILSVSDLQVHLAWIKTPRKKGGLGQMKIPLIADVKKACS